MVVQASTFNDLVLRPELRAALHEMGISIPTPIQAEAIPPLLAGRDVVGQARTGSGKTLAYGLPLVELCDPRQAGVQALVLVPTRELAIQVAEVLGKLAAARRMWLTLLYGGRPLGPEKQALLNGAQIVIGTPGRVLDHLWQGNLITDKLRLAILDEGDEMLDRGFAPDVEKILSFTPPTRQTALFSATLPDWVRTTASKQLRNPVTVAVDSAGETPPEIEQVVYEVPEDGKLGALCTLLDHRGEKPILVFGRTKHGVEKLGRQLDRMGYPVAAIQGNMTQSARERVISEFRSGRVQILLATNVAARGLDIQDIEAVINYELPESAELFTHRSGRTGRMGREGLSITLVTPADGLKWRQIERALGRQIPKHAWPLGGAATTTSPSPVEPALISRTPVRGSRDQRFRGVRRPAQPVRGKVALA